ncbi:MAG: lipid-A-disaccharide synthase N-terminal domain-containing protein [Candidatus Omnitrophota bacterium]
MTQDYLWLLAGFAAQFCFFSRFLVQWIATERNKESTIPLSFWYLSVAGAVGLLTYALHRRDPVFIIGPAAGLLIYLRNIYFLRRSKKQ